MVVSACDAANFFGCVPPTDRVPVISVFPVTSRVLDSVVAPPTSRVAVASMSPFTYSSLSVSACVPPTERVPVISVLPVTSRVLDSVVAPPTSRVAVVSMSPFTYSSLSVSACVPPTERVPVISVFPPMSASVPTVNVVPAVRDVDVSTAPVTYSVFVLPAGADPPTASLPLVTVSPDVPSTINTLEEPIANDPSPAVTWNVRAVEVPTLKLRATPSDPLTSVLPDDADTTNMSLVPSLIFRSPFRVTSELVRPIRSAAPFTPIEFPMKRMSSTSTYPKSLEIFRAPAVPAVCVRKALVAGSFTMLLRVVTPDTSSVPDKPALPVTSRVLVSVVAPAFSVPLSTVLPLTDASVPTSRVAVTSMSPFTYSSLVVSACVPPTERVPVISALPETSRVLDSVVAPPTSRVAVASMSPFTYSSLWCGVGVPVISVPPTDSVPTHFGIARHECRYPP